MFNHKKNPTLKDLAVKLGLSISTVSRALRQHPSLSLETIKRTKQLAEEMGYFPDGVARSLQQKKTKTIGVIVPEIRHFFFSSAIDGIEDATYKEGYTILIAKSNEDFDREIINTNSMISNRVDGLLVSIAQSTNSGKHFEQVVSRGIPLVFFDRVLNDINVHKVVLDDFTGAYEAVAHLVASGYRRIAHLAGPKNINITRERLAGYQQALTDQGMRVEEGLIQYCDLNESSGKLGAAKLLDLSERPDAICAVNDPVAIGAFEQIKDAGLRIPQDIGLTGFSNNPSSTIISPKLTTVDQFPREMGHLAARILLQEIMGSEEIGAPRTHVIPGKLIIRESTRLVRSS